MVKPPKIRHSKSRKDPVTIDLDPADVKREADETASAETAAQETETTSEAEQPVKPNAADEALADEDLAHQPEKDAAGEAAPDEAPANGPYYGRAGTGQAEPTARRSATSAALAAGVAGAMVALAGAAALQWAGALPASRQESAAVDSASLDVLRAEIEALKQDSAEGSDPALAQSLDESNNRIENLAATIEQLQADLAALQSQPAAGDASAIQSLETRLAEFETAAAAAEQDAAAVDDVSEQLAAMKERLTSALESSEAQAGRIDAIEQRLAETAEQVEAQAAEPGMAMAVAATSLKSAIDRGTPFLTELETYTAIAPDMPQVAALRELAASGVPTRAQIEAELSDAASRMAAAAAPADADAGFLERMFTSAQSLVEVRPVGSVEGDSPGATVARMEVAVRQGDYQKALEEYRTLPPAAQSAGEEFIAKVQERQEADRLIAEALAGAVKTPGPEGAPEPQPLPQDEG